TQQQNGQVSPASAPVTLHVQPTQPNFNNSNTVFILAPATSGTATLYGNGYYGAGLNPVAATIAISETVNGVSTAIGSAVVGPSGQWSTAVTLSKGSHALTAQASVSNLLGTETNPNSASVNLQVVQTTVNAPTLNAAPLTAVLNDGPTTISGTGVPGALL